MPRDPDMPPLALPQLCLGQVRHTRLPPRRHFFSYGMYCLRLSVRSQRPFARAPNRPACA